MLISVRAAVFAILASLAVLPAFAENERTILVLDGSGSMWGQIDGENKIVIARDVISGLLEDLPDDLELGLTVYGHRRKGDCKDIESVVAPGPETRGKIRDAVNAIKPKGKTPLSAAVLAAAEELKYGEEKATVILVSDGRETCGIDPCALGNQLEETGVDFTAHVVGFDVSEESDRAQLRCLAENTGGEFLSASTASELTEALQKVSAPPVPTTLDVTFAATIGEDGPQIIEDLVWTVTQVETGDALADHVSEASPTLTLDQKVRYLAEVLRTSDEAFASEEFTVGRDGPKRIVLALETPLPDATVSGPASQTVGLPIQVDWTGPDQKNDYIALSKPDAAENGYQSYKYTRDGSPVELTVPGEPGAYELRYVLSKPRTVLARQPISVEDAEATVDAAETATVSSIIKVDWTGPDAQHDYVSIAKRDPDDTGYLHYKYTRDGSPLELQMPGEAGAYEIRYVLGKGRRTLVRRDIVIEDAGATLAAADTASVGSTIKVEWTGPDARNDYISVAKPDAEGKTYENYRYTRDGSPVKLLMPAEPGAYEIRYVLSQGKRILSKRPIVIEDVEVSVSAPDTASVGATVKVGWVGPDARNDYISIAKPDAESNRYENYRYTRDGSPVKLLMPAAPGTYEIRYVLSQNKGILARQPISIEPAEVSLSGPDTAQAAETLPIEWTGPDAQNDYITVAKPDAPGNKYENYRYTRDGSPVKLQMPTEPGEYELRYVLSQKKVILARKPIKIETANVSLEAKDSVLSGGNIAIDWVGPNGRGDYITIALPGDAADKYFVRKATSSGSPLILKAPRAPSEYEIRYFLGATKEILARRSLTVTQAE